MKKVDNYLENQLKKNLKQSEKCYKKSNIYKCEKCKDLTFILKDDVAIPCECRSLRICETILENSGISEEFRKKTFDNFDYSFSVESLEAFKTANIYSKNFKQLQRDRRNSIIFMGQVGSGKTHLSLAIANKLMDSGIGVIYMPYRESIMSLKQNIMDEESYKKLMNRYKTAKVLLVDDLFKGGVTKSDLNIMFEIINHRYFNNFPMIISTEKHLEEIINIDEAIGSRIIEMSKAYIVNLVGKKLNYRIYG